MKLKGLNFFRSGLIVKNQGKNNLKKKVLKLELYFN